MEVSLIAHLEAREGKTDQLAARLSDLARHVRKEAGNRLFQVYRRCDEPNRFDVVETYADETAFASHLAEPHSVAFNAWLKDVAVSGKSELTFVEAIS
ncbi:putative quinol monooxygenase [Pleomorphomonas carboxyditropha]|uniref:putative quinol monooxygenase n=1 Tax=Pleomorphomonas carboxyditropha TaxID=2023338 RepID=UPI0013FD690C|nr:antibiotic biosynthesis monooxygenase [Pleomorphomonas carboxyditropha]